MGLFWTTVLVGVLVVTQDVNRVEQSKDNLIFSSQTPINEIAKLVYNSSFTMVYGTYYYILAGVYI